MAKRSGDGSGLGGAQPRTGRVAGLLVGVDGSALIVVLALDE